VQYWDERDTQKKSAQLIDSWGAVGKVSTYGHDKKTVVKAKLVSFSNLLKKIMSKWVHINFHVHKKQ
jgi:hypothetical protein